jgi:hypothetical protein
LAGAPSATKCLSRFSFLTSFNTHCREDMATAKHRFKAPKQFVMTGRADAGGCALQASATATRTLLFAARD